MTVREAKAQRANIQKMRQVLTRASWRARQHGDIAHAEACNQVNDQAMRLQTQILAEMPYQQNGKRGVWRR